MKQVVCLFMCVFLAACASSSRRDIQMTYDEKAPFDTYKTFSIEAIQSEKQYVSLNGLIETAIKDTMADKGLSYSATGKPDLLIRYATRVNRSEQMKLEQISTGRGVYTRSQMEAVNEGALLFNIIDLKTDKVVWKASSISDISNIDLDKITQVQADEAMNDIFKDYPSSLF